MRWFLGFIAHHNQRTFTMVANIFLSSFAKLENKSDNRGFYYKLLLYLQLTII